MRYFNAWEGLFPLCLPAKYSFNVKWPRPGVFAHVVPCLYSWWARWTLAFLQGSTGSLVSRAYQWEALKDHCNGVCCKHAAYCQRRWSETLSGNMIPTLKCWLIKIRTFCGNVSVLTNLLTKHRHISKLACQAGFSQKPAQFHASLPTQLLSSLPSSLLGRQNARPSDFPVLGQPVERSASALGDPGLAGCPSES